MEGDVESECQYPWRIGMVVERRCAAATKEKIDYAAFGAVGDIRNVLLQ